MTARDLLRTLQPRGPMIAATGALLVFLENALLLAGFGVALGLRNAIGGILIDVGLVLDLAGLALLGVGILLIARRDGTNERALRLGTWTGILCLAWLTLTVAWRVIGLRGVGLQLADLDAIPAGQVPQVLAVFFLEVQALMAVWIAATACLAAATLLFARFLKARTGRGSVAWPFFGLLNLAATVLLAGAVLAFTAGGVDVPILVTAAFLKIAVVPVIGLFAYASLAVTFPALSRAEGSATVAATPPTTPDPDGGAEPP